MSNIIKYNTEYTIFTFHENKLKVLLLQNSDDNYYIPGKIIEQNQTAIEVVDNSIEKYFSLTKGQYFARHIAVFDAPKRDYRGWIVSNVFYVIVNYEDLTNHQNEFFEVDKLEELSILYDHKEILEKMIENIKKDLFETTIAKYFLNEQFTVSELQSLLLCARNVSEISRTHFFTKIKSMPFIRPVLDENKKQLTKVRPGAKIPAKLYEFDETDYISSIYF